MQDIPIREAVLLWNVGLDGDTPAFAVRPLGHPDYSLFDCQGGACFADWEQDENTDSLKLKLMIAVWEIVAFYGVPVEMVRRELVRVPEYREMLDVDWEAIKSGGSSIDAKTQAIISTLRDLE